MRILILNWKDIRHPAMGGAEVLTHSIAEQWVQAGHEVTVFAPHFGRAVHEEHINGVRVIRRGNRLTVYIQAAWFVRAHQSEFDRIIDQVNTLPFWTPFYATKAKRWMLIHQIAREVWFYELPKPLAWLGSVFEPLMLKAYRQERVITVSESTKQDLLDLGFTDHLINIIPEGIDVPPVTALDPKEGPVTFMFAGRLTPMKRVDHIIAAFKLLKRRIPDACLSIAGSGRAEYLDELKRLAVGVDGITFHGRVSQDQKRSIMKQAWVMVGASAREGWGLFISEGAAVGTPSVVYNVPGLRDSTIDGVTGLVTKSCEPAELAKLMERIVTDKDLYDRCRKAAWEWASTLTWDRAAAMFEEYIVDSAD